MQQEVRMSSKLHSGIPYWLPLYGHPFFKSPLSAVPPRYALPKYRNVQQLRAGIEAIKDRLQEGSPTAYEIWQAELTKVDNEQKQLCPTCLDLTSKISSVNPRKGTGKKVYNKMVNRKTRLEKALELHRASGCAKVEVAVDFPILVKSQRSLPPPVRVPASALPKPAKQHRTKRIVLESYVHRQLYHKTLAGLKNRKNELNEGDLVAVLGPSLKDPFWILKCKDFSEPLFRFQWFNQNSRGGWDLLEEVHEAELGFATFVHWGFLFKGKNLLREPD